MEFLVDNQVVLIDDEDWPLVQGYNWHLNKGGYIYDRFWDRIAKRHETIVLHRLVMGLQKGDSRQVDHIHHNKLDNRKSKLRTCDHAQNQWNSKIQERNYSGCKGVCFLKDLGKWYSRITVNGRRIHLGIFDSSEEAVFIRKEAEKKYFGEFAYRGAA